MNRPHLSRRDVLRLSALGVLGGTTTPWFDALAQTAAAADGTRRRHKSCILLHMDGGQGQTDTWDMKPDAEDIIRGELRPINTAVPGIQICELLPKIAAQMNEYAIIRSVVTPSSNHGLAYRNTWETALFPSAGPTGSGVHIGSVVSSLFAQPNFGLPTRVTINRTVLDIAAQPNFGFLGPVHQASALQTDQPPASLTPRMPQAEFQPRYGLLDDLDQAFARRYDSPLAAAHRETYRNGVALMYSEKTRVFDLNAETHRVRDRYGRNSFGEGCVLARRLIEAGVPFVEVACAPRGLRRPGLAWDTHGHNFATLRTLCPMLDLGMTSLIDDLKDRGLLDDTLVVCMGEMGRTPRLGTRGTPWDSRDHFGDGWSVVLAGAGIKTAQVVGATNADGFGVRERRVGIPDLMATLLHALGIDPSMEFSKPDGRPRNQLPDARQMALPRAQKVALLNPRTATPIRELF